MGWIGNLFLVVEIEVMGCRVIVVECDVIKKDEVVLMIEQIRLVFGCFDVIVNNVGVVSDVGVMFIFEMFEEFWQMIMDINVFGMFLVSKYGGCYMFECGNGGSIIMIFLIVGCVGLFNYGVYCILKFVVVGFI